MPDTLTPEICADAWHRGQATCPSCGQVDTGYDRGYADGLSHIDALTAAVRDIAEREKANAALAAEVRAIAGEPHDA